MRSELLINFGSQKVTLSVRLSGTSLSKSLNLCLSLIGLSQVSLRSLCAYFVRQTEPKILRLVSILHDLIVTFQKCLDGTLEPTV